MVCPMFFGDVPNCIRNSITNCTSLCRFLQNNGVTPPVDEDTQDSDMPLYIILCTNIPYTNYMSSRPSNVSVFALII